MLGIKPVPFFSRLQLRKLSPQEGAVLMGHGSVGGFFFFYYGVNNACVFNSRCSFPGYFLQGLSLYFFLFSLQLFYVIITTGIQ